MKRILLAEDDYDLGATLKQYLELNKFHVTWALNGDEALDAFKTEVFDICILDVMMPILDGFTLAHKMEHINAKTPFLFVTARKTKEDRLKGLKLGADDYIVKPFEVEELILRLKNIIKRTEQQTLEFKTANKETIAIGNYRFDFNNLELIYKDEITKLTEKEALLIAFFFENKNQLIPRDLILAKVWNKSDFFSGRSMDVFISRVRKLFKDDNRISIKSVRGIGLEFNIDN